MSFAAKPGRWQVAAAFLAVYLIWGSTYLAIRLALDSLPPFLMAGVRYFIAGILLYAWARWRGAPPPTRQHWLSTTLVGALLLLVGNGGVVWAETRVPSGLASVVIATVPMWLMLLQWLRGSRPGARVLGGLLLGFIGTWILVGPTEIAGSRPLDPLGAGVLLLSALSWASGSLVARRVPLPAAPLLATGMEMLSGGVLLMLLGLGAGEWPQLQASSPTLQSMLSLLYLIVFGSLVGFSAYTWLLKEVATDKVATYAYVNPVVAVILGWSLGGEPLTARTLLAVTVVLAAVIAIVSTPRPVAGKA